MMDKKINILIVDDRSENLLALKAVLDSPSYILFAAVSGEEALRFLLKEQFAVILLDVQMPVMDGFETATLIRKREKSKHIPIIFITAVHLANEDVIRGYSLGAVDYIFKPFNSQTLKLKIAAFVKIHLDREKIKKQSELLKQHSEQLNRLNKNLQVTTCNLRRAEAMARVIGETSVDTIFTLNNDGVVITVNPAVEKMFGYTPEALLGQKFYKLLPKIDQNSLLVNLGKRTKIMFETVAEHENGKIFSVDVHLREAYVGEEQIYVVTIHDITERKLLDKHRQDQYNILEKIVKERTDDLHQANLKINNILESITDGFCALNNDLKFTYINKEAKFILDKRNIEVIGMVIWDVFPQNKVFEEILIKVIESQDSCHDELFFDTIQVWLEIHIYPSKDGVSIYFRNITQRKLTEENLRLSEERFSKAFNASPSMMSILSLDELKYVDVNHSWLCSTDFSRNELIGCKAGELGICSDLEDNYKIKEYLNSGSFNNREVRILTKKKEVRIGLASAVLISLYGEQCILLVINDITEIKRFEVEMARLDRLSLVGQMASGIGHEIRNPMTSIRGFLQILQEKNDCDQYNSYYSLMIEELDRVNEIIKEFLSIARNKPAILKRQNLNAIVEALTPLITADATNADKYLKLELEDVPDLLLNEKEIRQLILNLCRNGLEAMPAVGCLTIRTYRDGKKVVLSIQDQGEGITSEVIKSLGTPFFTTKDSGTGLGLAICYSIAERHNAKINIQTASTGTKFLCIFNSDSN